MQIREMSRAECLGVLAEARLARLACAFQNQPYVIPVYLAYHQPAGGEPCLYGFTTQGQKVEWMRANPRVCVEVDDVASSSQWVSVVVFGHYEELPAAPANNVGRPPAHQTVEVHEGAAEFSELGSEQLLAHRLLQAQGTWWEPATTARAASAHRDTAEAFIPIFYKVRIDQVTGHAAIQCPLE